MKSKEQAGGNGACGHMVEGDGASRNGTERELSSFGIRILRGIPPKGSIGTRTLGAQLHMESDWTSFQKGVDDLVTFGYLVYDANGNLTLTDQGKRAIC